MAHLGKISDTKWKQPFRDRKKEFKLWKSHVKVADLCRFVDGTKRLLTIEFDPKFNLNITDLFQITSGKEIYFPKELQDVVKPIILKNPDSFFTVEVVDVKRTAKNSTGNANDSESDLTDGLATIKTRIGQAKFRQKLLGYWSGCSVTGCKVYEVLKASHIKPWSEATDSERLNTYNGLLLTPNLDSAFDSGFISFKNNGEILISKQLSNADNAILNIKASMRLKKVERGHWTYLKYHREKKFLA